MAEPLPSFVVSGELMQTLGAGDGGEIATQGWFQAVVLFVPVLPKGVLKWDGEVFSRPPEVRATVASDGTMTPVRLLANDPGLSVDNVRWTVEISVRGNVIESWTFTAPGDNEGLTLAETLERAD